MQERISDSKATCFGKFLAETRCRIWFISKYNWGIERGDNGELTILDKKYKYDVNLEEDGTFVIWWRMSVAKAFLSTRHYPIYKNAIATMGIIAYEVQQVFSVGVENESC